jgi:tryptophan-rich sensory protein
MPEEAARSWKKIALFTVPAIVVVGDVVGLLSQSGFRNSWFAALNKPFFMPPGWTFGIVWNLLYALMGIALAMVLALPQSPRRKLALILFFTQLMLNYAWSPIFFAGHDIALAKVVIFLMAIIAAAAAGQFLRLTRTSGLLLIPYLAWLIFAAVLNSTIEALNPGALASLL